MLKEGDAIVRLANLIALQEVAKRAEVKRAELDHAKKMLRFKTWELEMKLAEGY